MTVEPWSLVFAMAAGTVLGGLYFGGLWWTVRALETTAAPGRLFAGSLVVRVGVVLFGIHVVAGGHWERIVACLVGVIVARVAVTRRIGRPPVRTAYATV